MQQQDKSWWTEIWRQKETPTTSSNYAEGGGWRPLPLEGDPSVEAFRDSTTRYVDHPNGMALQVISCEPLGEPHISLHQNHYAATSSLGSIRFGARDDITATMSAFADGVWSSSSRPTGVAFRVSPPGGVTPRHPALTLRADGRMSVGGGLASTSNPLVSLGVYRRGVFEMPSVDKIEDLQQGSGSDIPFVNGAMVYARDLDRVLVSQGGTWHAVLTTPVNSLIVASGSVKPRQMGAPRKDGKPAVFGPRALS